MGKSVIPIQRTHITEAHYEYKQWFKAYHGLQKHVRRVFESLLAFINTVILFILANTLGLVILTH
jgi:hypothetical protein